MTAVAATSARAAGWRAIPFTEVVALGSECWERATACVVSPFQRPEWHRAWSSVAPEETTSAFALAHADETGTVHEIVPLARRRRRIGGASAIAMTWASDDFGCPDHLDIPVGSESSVHEIADQLAMLDWDVLSLRNLCAGATRATQLAERFARMGFSVGVGASEPCPTLELPASWDAYLATQSPTRRQTIRRKERKLVRDHRVSVRDYAADTVDDGWKVLNALHSERWSGATAFSPRVAELHRRFAKALAARDALWLTTLELDGVPVAVWYGFTEGDTVFFFQSGRSLDHQQDSVGQVLMGMMIRRAIERGYRRFDFLRGDEPYKASWTTDRRTTWELVVTRPGLRGAWIRGQLALDGAVRVARARAGRALRSVASGTRRQAATRQPVGDA